MNRCGGDSPERAGSPLVRVAELTRRYGEGGARVMALDRVTLTVQRGEVAAVVGRSGSGKSTLVNLLGGLDHPDEGVVEVAGLSIGGLDADALAEYRRRTVGMVFQSFNLVATLSARDNVALPLVFEKVPRPEREGRAMDLLRRVGLESRASHLPAQLSGGEQQRVAIARALILDPPLLLADEPTGNLDSGTARGVIELLLAEGGRSLRTVVLVTHDEALADRVSDRQYHLADGRLIP